MDNNIVIDNSNLTPSESCALILKHVKKELATV